MKIVVGIVAAALTVAYLVVPLAAEAQTAQASQPSQPSQYQGQRRPRKGIKKTDVGYATVIKTVPPDFPLPVPPAATLQLAHTVVAESGAQDYYLRFQAKHKAEELVDWYEQNLKSGNWTTQKYPQPNGSIMITGMRKDGQRALIQFINNPKGDGSLIITNVGRSR